MKNLLKLSFLFVALSLVTACKNKSAETAKVSDTAGDVAAKVGKSYTVASDVSKVIWEGSKPVGAHSGTVDVSNGSVSVANGMVTGGSFTIDMNTINCTDLEGGKKGYLESHLKGLGDDNADDFFNVKKFPTAKFEITKVTKRESDAEANALVYGNLTMRDVTKEVAFKSMIKVTDNMVQVNSPAFKINRTEWGIKYNSPSFVEGLKDKAINDDISLKIDLVAK